MGDIPLIAGSAWKAGLGRPGWLLFALYVQLARAVPNEER